MKLPTFLFSLSTLNLTFLGTTHLITSEMLAQLACVDEHFVGWWFTVFTYFSTTVAAVPLAKPSFRLRRSPRLSAPRNNSMVF